MPATRHLTTEEKALKIFFFQKFQVFHIRRHHAAITMQRYIRGWVKRSQYLQSKDRTLRLQVIFLLQGHRTQIDAFQTNSSYRSRAIFRQKISKEIQKENLKKVFCNFFVRTP